MLYIFYMHFTLIVSVFMLSICDTEINKSINQSFEQTMMGWSPRCYIPSFVKICPPVLEKKIFEGFLPYMGDWAWRPSWSCDPDAANKISFPLPKEAPHKIWL